MKLLADEHDSGLVIDLDPDGTLDELMREQWSRFSHLIEQEAYCRLVQKRLVPVLIECLDWDLRTPTPAQIRFAESIARRLDLELPTNVLQRRSAMADFLDLYGSAVRAPSNKPRRT